MLPPRRRGKFKERGSEARHRQRIELARSNLRVERILEEIEAGVIHSAESVYTEYPHPQRDEWETKILPALRKIPPALLVKMSGLSPTTIKDMLAERSRPYPKNRERLAAIVRRLGHVLKP
jgi:hypothetical protein